ncbi:MAG: hypothetical protein JNK10_05980, partial [Cyclobacteriaceae bacterium]|nr:hypothetical protein [Cyclobacteriaceae bacterium]
MLPEHRSKPFSPSLLKFAVVALLFLGITVDSLAVTRYSVNSGSWNNNNTWSATSGGGSGASFPVAGDIVFIEGGDNVNVNVASFAANVDVAAGSTITITLGQSLTLSGNFSGGGTISGGGTLRQFNVGGNWTFNGTSTNSVQLTLNGTGNQILSGVINSAPATNGALIINKASGTVTMASNITVAGSTSSVFTLTAGIFDPATFLLTATTPTFTAGTLRVGAANWGLNYSFPSVTEPLAGIIEYNAAGAQTVNNVNLGGSLLLSGSGAKTLQAAMTSIAGSFGLSGTATTTGVAALTIGGTVVIGGGTTFTSGNFTHDVAGDWTNNGGTFTPGTGSVRFNGGAGQVINGSAATQTFNNIVVNKAGGTVTVGGSTTTINLGSLFNIAGNFTAPATLGATGSIVLTTGTFTAGTNTNIGVNFTNNGGTFVPGAGTVTFNGGGGQSINGTLATQTFNNIVVAKGGGILSAGGSTTTLNTANVTVNSGTFTGPATLGITGSVLLSGGTFNGGAATLLTGNWTNNGGTFNGGSGTVTFGGGVQSIGGSSSTTFHNLTTSSTTSTSTAVATTIGGNLNVGNGTTFSVGGFAFGVTGTTTVGSGGAANLTIGSTTATKTFTGLVTISASATWTNTIGSAITMRGGLTNNGTFNAGSGVYTFDTNSQVLTGTLQIANVTVSGVSLLNTGNLTVPTLLTGSGDLTQLANSNLTLTGSSTIGSINATAVNNTVTYDGAAQTIFPTSYYNLTVNQSSGVATVSASTRVNNTLNLAAGNVSLGTNVLTLGPSATAPGPVGIVLASAGGEMRKEYNATGSFTFPVGDNTAGIDSSPITVNVTAGAFASAYVGVKVTNAKHPNNASTPDFLTRYWTVTQSGITGCSANVTGTYVGGDISGAIGGIASGKLAGTFDQTTNGWAKGSALAGTVNMTGTSLGDGVPTAFTGITAANPTVNITGGGVTICAGVPVALGTNVTGDPTIIYSWSPPAGLSSTTIPNPVATPLVTTLYTVTIRDGNGISATNNTNITVNPTPDVLATPSSQVICTGTATNIALSTPNLTPGTTYTWTVSQSGVTGAANQVTGVAGPIAQTLTATGVIPGTATYAITPTAGTCSGTPINVIVTVNPTPAVSDPLDQVVCNGALTAAVNFSGTGTHYDWTNNDTSIGLAAAGTGNIAAFNGINATAVPVVATITVTPRYTFGSVTCSGTVQTFTITVNPLPSVTDPADQVVCNGTLTGAVTFAGSGTTGYTWTNNDTSIGLAASGSGNIGAFTATNAGSAPVVATITVTPVYGSCTGAVQTFTITVNHTPVVADPVDQVVCNGALTSAVTFVGTGNQYDWTNSTPSIGLGPSGTGNIGAFNGINATAVPVVATITVTPRFVSGPTCSGTVQTFTITVNPLPTVTDPADQVVCNGASTATVTFVGTGTTGYNWTNSDTSIGLAASGSGNIAAFTAINAGATPVVATITVTPVYGSCTGSVQTFTITVNPTPTVTDPTDQVVCNGTLTGAVTFTGTAGATFNWTNNDTSIGLGASGTGNIAAFTATNAGTIPVVATITVTPQTAGPLCIGTPQTFTITVNPTPTVSDPLDQVVCNGALTAAVNFSGTGTHYDWTNNDTSIGLAAA